MGWMGLQLYRQEHPDVIVLDLKMPGLDGVTVLKQIRSVDLTQPVIVLTGDTAPQAERQVRALGVSEFIIKGSSLHLLGTCATSVSLRLLPLRWRFTQMNGGPSHMTTEPSGCYTTEMGTASI